jgi:putative endonuclease
MSAWFVYVVRCRDGSLYTGISTDVSARLGVHNAGRGARYTRSRRPVRLVHVEPARSQSAALRREAAVKKLSRADKLLLVRSRRARKSNLRAARQDRASQTVVAGRRV